MDTLTDETFAKKLEQLIEETRGHLYLLNVGKILLSAAVRELIVFEGDLAFQYKGSKGSFFCWLTSQLKYAYNATEKAPF